MKVTEFMNTNIPFCSPDTDLAAVAALMWQSDCGALPVVAGERLEGILTDRDICIALGTRSVCAHTVRAADVASRDVFTCSPDDEIHGALKTMRTHKVRRLPVIDGGGKLVGLLSLNEVILRSNKTARRPGDITYDDVFNTVKTVCEHRAEAAQPKAAGEKALAAMA